MAFSASESAFEGFRIIRREPGTVAIWAVILLVLTGAIEAALAPFMQGFGANLATGGASSSGARLAALGNLGLLYLAAVPIYLVVMSVFTAAVYRVVLRPEEKGFARLRFGGDELRLMGLYVLMALFFIGLYLLLVLVVVLVGGGLALAIRSAGAGSGAGAGMGVAAVLAAILAYLAVLAGFVWLAVKLSFAAPMTFVQRRIRLFGSWGATKGRFWSLLGCYLLVFVFIILVALVDAAISAVFMIGMAGGSLSHLASSMLQPNTSMAALMLSPIYLVRLAIGAIFGVAIWTIQLAAPARAYREIAGPRPEDQAEAFS